MGVSQPGAAPAEMEKQVTQQVEAAVRGVNGVDEIDSSVSEGYSQTVVQLQIGTPIDRAVNDVRNAVAQVRGNLPEGILEPTVQRIDTSGAPIVFIAAETTDMTLEQLSWYIDNDVAKRLRGLPGVAAVAREGGVDREIRVILDPTALEAQGLTAAQVNQQLRQSNINAAGGRAEIAGSEQSVRVLGNAPSAYELSQTSFAARRADGPARGHRNGQGRLFRAAVAREAGRQAGDQLQRATGEGRVGRFRLRQGVDGAPQGRESRPAHPIFRDQQSVDYTKNQYKSAMEGLLEGAILAVLVVLLFLRDIRATAISALAIPMSAIPAFWFMDMLGYQPQRAVAAGDEPGCRRAGRRRDRRDREHRAPHAHGQIAYQAAIDAADEIGLAVVATSLSIVAVFLPVA